MKLGAYIGAEYCVLLGIDREHSEMVVNGQYTAQHVSLRIPATFCSDREDGSDPGWAKSRRYLSPPSSMSHRLGHRCAASFAGEGAVAGRQSGPHIANVRHQRYNRRRSVKRQCQPGATPESFPTPCSGRFRSTFDEYLANVKTHGPTRSLLVQPVVYSAGERVAAVIVLGSTTRNAFSADKVGSIAILDGTDVDPEPVPKVDGVCDYHELIRQSIMRLQVSNAFAGESRSDIIGK